MEAERENKKPGVGVAVIVWTDHAKRELLLGLGHSNREALYALPGGHWESGETLLEAARRETMEEAGIEISACRFISLYEFYNNERGKSYIVVGFEAIIRAGKPTVMEPEKKVSWGWYSPVDALSLPLFAPDRVLIERTVSGIIFDSAC